MPEPVIELIDVVKQFALPDGERLRVLDVPRFAIQDAEQVSLEGRSGSGKSTLLNVISGILRPDSGQVRIDSLDIAALPEAARDRVRADRLGMVFQSFNLLPGFTALENVLVAMSFGSGRPERGRAVELLAAVGLGHRLSHRPASLSVGEQQRVAVARALANRPRVILADEPTASIDPHHQDRVIDLLRMTCRERGVALVLVTHAPEVACRFERRLRIEDFNRALVQPGGGRAAVAAGSSAGAPSPSPEAAP